MCEECVLYASVRFIMSRMSNLQRTKTHPTLSKLQRLLCFKLYILTTLSSKRALLPARIFVPFPFVIGCCVSPLGSLSVCRFCDWSINVSIMKNVLEKQPIINCGSRYKTEFWFCYFCLFSTAHFLCCLFQFIIFLLFLLSYI